MIKFFKFLLLLLFFFTPISTYSQGPTTGGIAGTVTDNDNDSKKRGVIIGAIVKIKCAKTNFEQKISVDEKGNYSIVNLPPGDYELIVEAAGFSSETKTVTVSIGETILTKITLGVGRVEDYVEVNTNNFGTSTENFIPEPDDSRKERVIPPVPRRMFLDFAVTLPRITRDKQPVEGVAASSGFSNNGQSSRNNNITVEGLDNNDFASGSVRTTVSQNAVQELKILTNNYSAEFGRSLGAVINIITKSGGNDYHSNLFLNNRNDKISARDVFASSKTNYSQYQFGLNVEGPIKKSNAFFFGAFERLSIKQNNIVTISNALVNSALRQGFILHNGPIPFSVGITTALVRTDCQPTSNDTFAIRYNFGGIYNGALEPFGGLIGESNAGVERLTDNTVVFSNTKRASSSRLVNETRFLYNRRNQNVSALDNGPQIQAQALEGDVAFGRGIFLPQPRVTNTYQITNTSIIVKGDRQIKFGIDFLYFNNPKGTSKLPILAGGLANFSPIDFSALTGISNLPAFSLLQSFDPTLRTPNQRAFLTFAATQLPILFPGFPKKLPLANLALPLAYTQGFGDATGGSTGKLLSVFLQSDIIKIKQSLLLDVGVRYDLNRIKFLPSNKGNFSPRIALSYRLQNLNIHANYGIFFGAPLFGPAIGANLSSSGALKLVSLPFPFSIIPYALPGHHFQESQNLPDGIKFTPQLSRNFQVDHNLHNSYSQQINFGFDYKPGKNTSVSADYVFVRGIKLLASRNINPIVYPIQNNPVMSAITGRVDSTRGDVFEFESSFDSYYHAFSAGLKQQFKDKFSITASYTLSKAIDNFINLLASVDDDLANPLQPGNERGLSIQDVRQRFILSSLLQFNYFKKPWLNGIQLTSFIVAQSGSPYNLLAGVDLDMNGDFGGGDRPLSLGRNVGVLPNFINCNIRLSRTLTIKKDHKEGYRFEGFVEIFNLFNRVNINNINKVFLPDSQGHFSLPPMQSGRYISTKDRYISALPPRQLEIGFRLSF